MKSLTLASLLATSAAVGAGAAAAGSPFFFAVTEPIAETSVFVGGNASSSVSNRARIITDVSAPFELSGRYDIFVGGVRVYQFGHVAISGSSGNAGQGPRDARLSLAHGIPVPAGTTLSVSFSNSQVSGPISISGYCYD